jgi:hypothetical protein
LMPNHFHLVLETPQGQSGRGHEMASGRLHQAF